MEPSPSETDTKILWALLVVIFAFGLGTAFGYFGLASQPPTDTDQEVYIAQIEGNLDTIYMNIKFSTLCLNSDRDTRVAGLSFSAQQFNEEHQNLQDMEPGQGLQTFHRLLIRGVEKMAQGSAVLAQPELTAETRRQGLGLWKEGNVLLQEAEEQLH